MGKPLSAISSFRSADRRDLLVPRVRTDMAQHRAFAIVDSSMWNDPPPNHSIRSMILVGVPPLSLRCLKAFLFPRGWHAEGASKWLVL